MSIRNNTLQARAIFAMAMTLFALAVTAQDKPNFTGKWVLDRSKSEFAAMPVPESQTNTIEHKEPNITLTQTITGDSIPGGQASTQRRWTTDGKENTNDLGQQQVKSKTKWEGNKLVTVTTLEGGRGEIQDLWELTDNGKQLEVTRDFKGPQGQREQKLIFKKQN
jgi:hypothetical protein